MIDSYFSEREHGVPPRDKEKIEQGFWNGFRTIIQTRINDASLAERFPINCPDAPVPIGCDELAIKRAFQSEFPSIGWHFYSDELPDSLLVLDAVEFFYRYISKPINKEYHSFFSHHHFILFDKNAGQQEYLDDVNRLFRRNNLAFELREDGCVMRLEPIVLRESLRIAVFRTEDEELNRLLELAREKFRDPDLNIRREAVEKLWDAWERLKTIESGKDKKKSITVLLNKGATEPKFRETLEREAKEMTYIGNTFRIRHSETNQVPLECSEHVDYLFHRLFALIHMLLRITNRVEEQRTI